MRGRRDDLLRDRRRSQLLARSRVVRPVLDALALDRTGSVIDLGCGAGSWALELACRGHRVVAIDTRADAIAWVRAEAVRLRVGVECICADFTRLALNVRFDLVIQIFTGVGSMQPLSRFLSDRGLALWRESYTPVAPSAEFHVEQTFPHRPGLCALRRPRWWNDCSISSCEPRQRALR